MSETWQDFSIEGDLIEDFQHEKKYTELVLRDLKGKRIVFEGSFVFELVGDKILVSAVEPSSEKEPLIPLL
jgi:hypothetical protein